MRITLSVVGIPAPKGSARAFVVKGRAVLAPGGSAVNKAAIRSWDQSVRLAAAQTIHTSTPPFVATPVRVFIEFRLVRPGGHWGKRGLLPSAPAFPVGKPDVDKLARATLDALIGSVMDDDARIVDLRVAKTYAAPGRVGATIVVETADAPAA